MACAAGTFLDVGNCVTSGSGADLSRGLDLNQRPSGYEAAVQCRKPLNFQGGIFRGPEGPERRKPKAYAAPISQHFHDTAATTVSARVVSLSAGAVKTAAPNAHCNLVTIFERLIQFGGQVS